MRDAALGVELLESRELLSATPTLSIPSGQFFGAGFTPLNVSFQVNFADVLQSPGEIVEYDYTIDWGDGIQPTATLDGDPMEPTELEFRIETPFGQNEAAGDPIRGRINERPLYTSPGTYTVTVTVNDTVLQTQVTVYPIDFGLFIGDPMGSEFLATEGSPFTLTLPTEMPDETPIDSWIINWGDAIATDGGGTSAVHTYMDDSDIQLTGPAYNITAAAVTSLGTFYAGGTNFMSVDDVTATTTISGDASVDAGDLYTLNLSNLDPGNDPIVGWIVFWEGLSNLGAAETVIGNPASVTHTYATGGVSHNVIAWAFTDEEVQNTSNTLALTVNAVQQDGVFLVNGELSVVDTNPANDIVTISQSNGNISVTSNGGTPVVFSAGDVDAIEVVLGSGHDIVVVNSSIPVPLRIDGGAGNDFLSAGGGPALLIGGAGNDILWGGPSADKLFGGDNNDDLFGGGGNDSLVGGAGNDIVHGGAGSDVAIGGLNEDLLIGGGDDDILIGGSTIYSNVDGLDEIMAIWGSTDSFTSRVAQLTGAGGLLAATGAVSDDDAIDIIVGGAGRDLVFGDTNPADGAFDILALSPIQDVLVAVI